MLGRSLILFVYACELQAEFTAVAYCAGIPLLLDAALLISIQLLVVEILGVLLEFFLKFRACIFLVEFGLTCRVVRLGAPLSCASHPLLPVQVAVFGV